MYIEYGYNNIISEIRNIRIIFINNHLDYVTWIDDSIKFYWSYKSINRWNVGKWKKRFQININYESSVKKMFINYVFHY